MKLSIVVCVRNQRDTLLSTLDRLWAAAPASWQVEAVVVDNHSTDGTRDLLRGLETANLQVIYLPRRRSSAVCWRAAIAHLSGDYVLLDPRLPVEVPGRQELSPLVEEAQRGAAAVYSAPPPGAGRRDPLTLLLNALFDGSLSSVPGAKKLVRAEALRALKLRGGGLALETDLTARLLRAGFDIRQVPIAEQRRRPPPSSTEYLAALGALLVARLDPAPLWRDGVRPALSTGNDAWTS